MIAVGDRSSPACGRLTGGRPAGAPIGSVTVRFEDGTETAAAHGPGWFVFLVDPARLRPGHRPVGVDITRTDGAGLRRFTSSRAASGSCPRTSTA